MVSAAARVAAGLGLGLGLLVLVGQAVAQPQTPQTAATTSPAATTGTAATTLREVTVTVNRGVEQTSFKAPASIDVVDRLATVLDVKAMQLLDPDADAVMR